MKSVRAFVGTAERAAIFALVFLLGCVSVSAEDVASQPLPISPILAALRAKVQTGDRNAVATFWADAAKRTTPIVEPAPGDPKHVIVTFVWRATQPTSGVVLIAQLGHTRDPMEGAMTNLPGTDIWYRAYQLRPDLRFSYGFQVTSSSTNTSTNAPDPLNPPKIAGGDRLVAGIAGAGSIAELPQAPPQPWLAPIPGVSAGKVDTQEFKSDVLKNQHQIWTYLPAGYDPKGKPYPVLICFFGGMFVSRDAVSAPTTLDNLIAAHRMPPTVGIFIDDPKGEGNEELRNHRSFLNFMADEVYPWAHKQLNITSDPKQTTLCGASAAGLASGYLALQRPDLFGNVLSESGAYWRGNEGDEEDFEWVRKEFEKRPKLPIRFVLQTGALEITPTPNSGPSINVANHRLRDSLVAKGYDVHFSVEPGGHEPLSWRGGLADGLIYLASPPEKVSQK